MVEPLAWWSSARAGAGGRGAPGRAAPASWLVEALVEPRAGQ